MPTQLETIVWRFAELFGYDTPEGYPDGVLVGADNVVMLVPDDADFNGNFGILDECTERPDSVSFQYFKEADTMNAGYRLTFDKPNQYGDTVTHLYDAEYVEPALELFDVSTDYITALEEHARSTTYYGPCCPMILEADDHDHVLAIAPRAE